MIFFLSHQKIYTVVFGGQKKTFTISFSIIGGAYSPNMVGVLLVIFFSSFIFLSYPGKFVYIRYFDLVLLLYISFFSFFICQSFYGFQFYPSNQVYNFCFCNYNNDFNLIPFLLISYCFFLIFL
jgi:hypothetical protein